VAVEERGSQFFIFLFRLIFLKSPLQEEEEEGLEMDGGFPKDMARRAE
jgi:hypothetical protein